MKKKKNLDNKCPKCNIGFLFNVLKSNKFGEGQWIENCTDCNYSQIHECRRIKDISIKFVDRRENG